MVPDYTVAIEEALCDLPAIVMLGVGQGTCLAPGAESRESLEYPTAFAALSRMEG